MCVCVPQVTKLVDNYRAHGLLVKLYSELFYDGELVEQASHEKSHCLCSWEMLPMKGVPLVFHGVQVGRFMSGTHRWRGLGQISAGSMGLDKCMVTLDLYICALATETIVCYLYVYLKCSVMV